MRIIDLGLLNNDLIDKGLPPASISTVDQIVDGQRSTYVPYFSEYLRIVWTKEPPENYLSSVSAIVSNHMATPISSDTLVEKTGTFPEVGPAYNEATEKEAVYKFTSKISDQVIPLISEIIATGIQIREIQISGTDVYEHLEGGDENLKSKLLRELKVEPALVDLSVNNIMCFSGNSGSSLSVNQIFEWLLKAALKVGTKPALTLLNKFLLESKGSSTHVLCIDGFRLDNSIDLLTGVRFITTEDLKKLNGYKRVFEPGNRSMQGFRNPTAAIVWEVTSPKFIYADSPCIWPNNKYNLGAIT